MTVTSLDAKINRALMVNAILLLEELHRNSPNVRVDPTPRTTPVQRTPLYMSLKSELIMLVRECPDNLFHTMLGMELSEPLKEILRIEGIIK